MKAEITCNKLLSRFLSYGSGKDEDLIRRAFKLAADVHIHQKRDNGDPYITHPLAVAVILARFHLDAASICTALLHDVIEDTALTDFWRCRLWIEKCGLSVSLRLTTLSTSCKKKTPGKVRLKEGTE